MYDEGGVFEAGYMSVNVTLPPLCGSRNRAAALTDHIAESFRGIVMVDCQQVVVATGSFIDELLVRLSSAAQVFFTPGESEFENTVRSRAIVREMSDRIVVGYTVTGRTAGG